MSEDKNLREAGLKVTLPRVRILEIFDKSSERHLSADDVYKKIFGKWLIYRTRIDFLWPKRNVGEPRIFEGENYHD